MTEPTGANERYWAVAHTAGRSVVPSSAAMAAPSAAPPNRNREPTLIFGVMGRIHRIGLCVDSRPSHSRASIRATLPAGAATGGGQPSAARISAAARSGSSNGPKWL